MSLYAPEWTLDDVIIVTPERRDAAEGPIASLLISTPMKEKGAQEVMAQGIPQRATRKVAKARDRASGAKIIVAANMTCEISHVIWRSGRIAVIFLSSAAIPGGGRGVNLGRLLSGGWTQKGKRTDAMNVMDEKTTRDKLPTRPTSPSMSLGCVASLGTSYRKYVSPTQVVL